MSSYYRKSKKEVELMENEMPSFMDFDLYDTFFQEVLAEMKKPVDFLQWGTSRFSCHFSPDVVMTHSEAETVLDKNKWTIPLYGGVYSPDTGSSMFNLKKKSYLLLTSDTFIRIPDGREKSITELDVGDVLLGRRHDKGLITKVRLSNRNSIFYLRTERDHEIRSLSSHRFLTDKGYVQVSDLTSETFLIMEDNSSCQLTCCFEEENNRPVYIIEVVGLESILTNGFITGGHKYTSQFNLEHKYGRPDEGIYSLLTSGEKALLGSF